MLCLALVGWNYPITASTNEVVINEDNLNLRSGPGTNYENLGQVHKGDIYTKVGEQSGWVEIQLEGFTAWVSSEFVSKQEDFSDTTVPTNNKDSTDTDTVTDSTNTEESTVQKTIKIPYNKTQIRNGPSTEHDIINLVKEGEELQVIGETDKWFKVKLDDSEGYVFKELVDESNEELTDGVKGKTIVIDPGHGGDDSGALGNNGIYEKDLTYKTADILAQELILLGAEVIMTRDQETFVTLESRATLSNVENADAFISLHYNSVPDLPNVTGIGTYYHQEQYEPLANYIQEEIIKESGDRDRGVDFGDFQVIRQNLMPSVLIELGFISNPEIEQLLLTNVYQEKLVSGIVNGLQRYFSIQ